MMMMVMLIKLMIGDGGDNFDGNESRGNKKLCFRTVSLGQTRIQCEACRAKTKLFFILPRLNMAAL